MAVPRVVVSGVPAAVALVVALSGCGGSSRSGVALEGGTASTGGKAIALSASTDEKLAAESGKYELELRGILLGQNPPSTFDAPDYRAPYQCTGPPCEWTLTPEAAGTFEYRAFLLDTRDQKPKGESKSVQIQWTPSPRPHDLRLLINGKSLPTTPLDGGDDYHDFAVGKMHAEARWKTDAAGTGTYVSIGTEEPHEHVYARCRTGTSCIVPQQVPIAAEEEVSWVLEVKTTHGDRVVAGFKICLDGRG